ncbi:hypothetical protein AX769_14945 [Frondihabitans sp. PAMC 28766]|nr:hypothetical protein AX769_14945 [Frondihabitans sp. PAMC 28766]
MKSDVSAFLNEAKASRTRLPVQVTDVVTTAAVAFGGGLLFIVIGLVNRGFSDSVLQAVLGSALLIAGTLASLYAVAYGIPRIVSLARAQPRHLFVEKGFAIANGFDFFLSRSHAKPPFTGIPFRLGTDRVSFEVMRSNRLPFVEWGNYRYSLKPAGARNVTFVAWGYLRVPLTDNVPNALFCLSKVKQMRRLTRIELPRNPEPSGAFDLYCEPADRLVATAILDDETVELLRKNKFSFEFADGYFYVYFAGLFRFWKPETVNLLADIVTRVENTRVVGK